MSKLNYSQVDLQESYAEILAEELKKEIDASVLEVMLTQSLVTDQGWTRVNIVSTPESSAWIHKNATGDYKYFNRGWYFEKAVDATAFILKFK